MMKDVNFPECRFSADMAVYMYGELSSDESAAFEQHLLDCSTCTDEFAAISSARYEVYDWKKLEFDPLETPNFDLPSGEVDSVSWTDKIRSAFAGGWAVPTISFAAFAIISVVVAGLIWRQDSSVEIVSKNTDPVTTAVPAKNDDPAASDLPAGDVANVSEQTPPIVPATTRSSISKHAPPKRSELQSVRATRLRPVDVKQATAKNEQRAVPTLNEYPDDEDTSLRLAELLEDIGSR